MAKVRGGITVKPHVQRFADACQAATGADSYGTYNGHSPPEGPTQALDIFNPDNTTGYALQDRVVAFAKANAKRYGVRYVIRRRQIWNIERDAEGWRNQSVTGNRTADHFDHVHITFYATAPGPFGDAAPARPKEDQLFSPSPIAAVHLIAGHSGLLLTSSGDSHGSGVTQERANGSLNQRWQMVGHADGTVSFVNRAGDLALDRPDYVTEPGTLLQVARTEHNDAQRWQPEELADGRWRIWAPGTNRCLDLRMASKDAGAGLQLWVANEGRWQSFDLAHTV